MKRYLATSLALFALLGAATTMLGPLLPALEAQFHLSDRQLGLLFVAQFCGGFCGAIASGEIIRRASIQFTVRLGYLLMAAGVACVPWPSPWALGAGIAIYGVGTGLVTPSISVGVCETFRNDQARALNLLNFAWAVGAIAAPGMVFRVVQHSSLGLRGSMLGAAAVLGLAALFVPRVEAEVHRTQASRLSPRELTLILITGLIIFAYVGVENGVAGWLPSFVLRVHGFAESRSALLQALFWTALLAGRLITGVLIRPGLEHRFLYGAMLAALAGTLTLLAGHGVVVIFAAVILCGAAFAPIFPTTIAVLSNHLSAESRERLGWMYAAGGLGGAVLPFCIGAFSSAAHSLRAGLGLLLVAQGVMLAAYSALRARSAATPPPAAP